MTLQEACYLALNLDGAFVKHEKQAAFHVLDLAADKARRSPHKFTRGTLAKEYRQLAGKIWDHFGNPA